MDNNEDCNIEINGLVISGLECKLMLFGIATAIILFFVSIGYNLAKL